MKQILKRTGVLESWDIKKIEEVIRKALCSVDSGDYIKLSQELANEVGAKFKWKRIVPQEAVQDAVENILMERGHKQAAKNFILYREKRRIAREIGQSQIDIMGTITDYIDRGDWRIRENSNIQFSFQGLILYLAESTQSRYCLNLYPESIRNAHSQGFLHIHDLGFGLAGYCLTGDTKVKLVNGTNPTLKELSEIYKDKVFDIYSVDSEGNLNFCKAYSPRLTRRNASLVEIKLLGYDKKIRCTPDHKFMLRDGTYKEAQYLEQNESLMPCNLKYAGDKYVVHRIWNPLLQKTISTYVHRIKIEQRLGRSIKKNEEIHHKNGIKSDNRDENLELLLKSNHRAMELKKTKKKYPIVFEENLNQFKENTLLRNKSEEFKDKVSEMAKLRPRGYRGRFISKEEEQQIYMNHKVEYVRFLNEKEDVYCLTVEGLHNFVLDCGVVSHNCAGWSLGDLLREGINNIGYCSSNPARNFTTAINHIVNFMGTLQNEWAGAMAFNSIDTYLAPFIRFENLTYRQVYQNIQSLIFNLNTTSRWGGQCCDETTECLSLNGWKKYDELKEGELIYTYDLESKSLKLKPIKKINMYDYDGDMIHMSGRKVDFLVTPNHKVVRELFNSGEKMVLQEAEGLMALKTPFNIPLGGNFERDTEFPLSDDEIRLLAWCLSDSHMEKDKDRIRFYQSIIKYHERVRKILDILGIKYSVQERYSKFSKNVIYQFSVYGDVVRKFKELTNRNRNAIPEEFKKQASIRQLRIFINELCYTDGIDKGFKFHKIDDNNPDLRDHDCVIIGRRSEEFIKDLQEIIILAGYSTGVQWERDSESSHRVVLYQQDKGGISKKEYTHYKGKVWCPTTEVGTFVARHDGKVFITGNSPFTNVTLDVVCPKYMRNQPVIIGGELQKETYGEFQKEMDIFNNAFLDVFMKGDRDGRIFSFPIPTYNITKEFPWDTEFGDKLAEMTGKYGVPYFQNFINSDLNPEDVRSMCPLRGDTEVIVKSDQKGIRNCNIDQIVNNMVIKNTKYEVWNGFMWVKAKPVKVDMTEMFRIKFNNGAEVDMGENHLQPIMGSEKSVLAKDLKVGMWVPFNKNEFGSDLGCYSLGYVVGAYAGDGSSYKNNQITYSLHSENDGKVRERLIDLWSRNLGCAYYDYTHPVKKIRNLSFFGKSAFDLIKKYVSGDGALDKGLTRYCFNASVEFKRGFLQGYADTDGSKDKKRLYTSSEKLKKDVCSLLSTLGMKYLATNVDNREERFSNNPVFRIDYPERDNYGDYFKSDDNFNYFRIIEIEKISSNKIKNLYCFEVESDSHIFMLANGLMTHNCRLHLDRREIIKKTGGIFGSGDLTGCYDDETEVLTDNGWKLFKNVDKLSDSILSMDDNKDIEWVPVEESFEYDYEGEIYNFKSNNSDLRVTPNHRMLEISSADNIIVERAYESITKKMFKIPVNNSIKVESELFFKIPELILKNRKYPERKIPYSLWAKFMGIYLSEGSTNSEYNASGEGNNQGYRISISQNFGDSRNKIIELLKKLPWHFKEEGKNIDIYDKPLWLYLKQFGNRYEKCIPEDLKRQGVSILNDLWHWLLLGDGTINKGGTEYYWTTSKRLKDDVQEILALMGFRSNSILQKKKDTYIRGRLISKDNQKDCYMISKIRGRISYIKNKNTIKEQYKGKVYCLQIRNNTMLVRRNGKVNWCGNSIGVVTLNLARLGYLAKNKDDFLELVEHYAKVAKNSLEIKRKTLEYNMEHNMFPWTRRYLNHGFKGHFSTIGLVAGHEACLNLLGKGIDSDEGKQLMRVTLNMLKDLTIRFQEETGNLYNLEATPAEGCTYRLAKLDKQHCPGIIQSGEEVPFYTNSTQLPVDSSMDVIGAVMHQSDIQEMYTGGTVFHTFLGESVMDKEVIKKYITKVFSNTRLPYLSITPTFSICPDHGYIRGEHKVCPECGKPVECFSRIVGYYRSITSWNVSKQGEFKERKVFKLNE